jgi:tRNA1(Val) A37 N6-methylase TrmN6
MNLPITTRVAKARGGACGCSPSKQLKRSTKVALKAAKTAIKGQKAVDEGKDKKATRLLKRAARQENRSINIEERENDYDLKRRGFNSMSRDGIA